MNQLEFNSAWSNPGMFEILHECQISTSDRGDELEPGKCLFIPGSPGSSWGRTKSEVHFKIEGHCLKMTWQPGNGEQINIVEDGVVYLE